ncbi:MAG: hypothetical protein QM530_10910 [Phycisphaerales bacterium]|nr:hypothetical protein [Phycisphaerales bacterium]
MTWYENYAKARAKLGQDLLKHLELALTLSSANKIMFLGMMEGWFTRVKLSTYFNATPENWVKARKSINGLDKANLITRYGHEYYAAISYTK